MSTTVQRKVVYYIAVSVDGFIAGLDGNLDGFSMEAQSIPDYIESLQKFDTVLMGKHTYEIGYQYGIQPGQPSPTYAHMMQYVFSQSMETYDHKQLKVIRDDPAEFVTELKMQAGRDIYLCGGGQLAGYLMDAKVVDEVILKVNPVILGQGIPVFGGYDAITQLTLLDTKIYQDGNIFLRYQIA